MKSALPSSSSSLSHRSPEIEIKKEKKNKTPFCLARNESFLCFVPLTQVELTPLYVFFISVVSSGFQMTVRKNNAIAMVTLSDWLKKFTPVFQPMRNKTKTNRTLHARFFLALSKLQIIARNSDWFIALFVSVAIGRSNYFG